MEWQSKINGWIPENLSSDIQGAQMMNYDHFDPLTYKTIAKGNFTNFQLSLYPCNVGGMC